uniref:GLOBIN domain-containing protein n=1 Tax=Panagrellus redivivus TaxID=6233 RepID=A0A7E4VL03_PANRE
MSSGKQLRKKGKKLDSRSKSVLGEHNGCDSSESDSGIAVYLSSQSSRSNCFIKKKHSSASNGAVSSARVHVERSTGQQPSGETNSPPRQEHLLAPPGDHYIRKGSYCGDSMSSLTVNNVAASRRRSRSLCAQQLKNDCQTVANGQANGSTVATSSSSSTRRTSNGVLPSLTRLRIQQCYKNAKPSMAQLVLKRACTLRSDIKMFLSYLPEERVEELASDIYNFITDCVNNIEEPEKIAEISTRFGEAQAALCNVGFRPEFFSTIADATIAECVRLDGGAHKRCETLLAWSQLMAVMFSSVRDGYYAQIRMQRRSSLPQHRMLAKQASVDVRTNNSSFENDG